MKSIFKVLLLTSLFGLQACNQTVNKVSQKQDDDTAEVSTALTLEDQFVAEGDVYRQGDNSESGVAVIFIRKEDQTYTQCYGTVVDGRKVVTAKHCFKGIQNDTESFCKKDFVAILPGSEFSDSQTSTCAQFLESDESADMVTVELEKYLHDSSLKKHSIANNRQIIGDKVHFYKINKHSSGELRLEKEVCETRSGIYLDDSANEIIFGNCDIKSGVSGSPLFQDNRIIGMIKTGSPATKSKNAIGIAHLFSKEGLAKEELTPASQSADLEYDELRSSMLVLDRVIYNDDYTSKKYLIKNSQNLLLEVPIPLVTKEYILENVPLYADEFQFNFESEICTKVPELDRDYYISSLSLDECFKGSIRISGPMSDDPKSSDIEVIYGNNKSTIKRKFEIK